MHILNQAIPNSLQTSNSSANENEENNYFFFASLKGTNKYEYQCSRYSAAYYKK